MSPTVDYDHIITLSIIIPLQHRLTINDDIVSQAMATGYSQYAMPELETNEISSNYELSERAVRAGDDVEDENLLFSIKNNVSAADFEVCIANTVP